MDLNLSEKLFFEIYGNNVLGEKVKAYTEKHLKKVERYLKLCRKNRWELFMKKTPEMKLSLIFAYLPELHERYKEKGIGDKIFFDTVSDIRVWTDDCEENFGKWGLDELNWLQNHMKMNIFKIGRLQFQFMKHIGKPYEKNGRRLLPGSRVLNVHIPRGGRLDIDECEKSFDAAREFFTKYYPDYPCDTFVCFSWLLYPENKNYMKKGSNILLFSELFTLLHSFEHPSDTYRWLYGKKVSNKTLLKNKKKKGFYGTTEKMPQETSLQKALTAYISQGGKLGIGIGIR